MPGRRGQSKYTFEVCRDLAAKCQTKADFKRLSSAAYAQSRKTGWLARFTWFENGKKKPKRLTFEVCERTARQCETLKQFYRDHYPEWAASKRQGWIGRFDWLKRAYHKEWTFDACREEALKYSTKKDFREERPGAYAAARDKGWLNRDFTWLKDQTINLEYGRIYSVYRYEFDFDEKKYEYVGLTMRPKERDRRHREQESPVHDFAISHNLPIPPMIIIERNLTQVEARQKEDFFRKLFADAGYQMLNRGPTGADVGSVGGMHRKWTKKACLAEAKKYKTSREFQKANNGAYLACTRHKWISECKWFVNGRLGARKYTEEVCEAIARKCSTLREFREHNASAYQVAKKNGWLGKYLWIRKRGEVDPAVKQEIRDLYRSGKTLKEVARELGLSVFTVERVVKTEIPEEFRGKRHSLINEQEVLDDLKKPWKGTKSEFAALHGFPSLDSFSHFLKAHGVEMKYREYRLSYEDCLEVAKRCKTRAELKSQHPGAYGRARKERWLERYTWFVNGRIKWTFSACQKESMKYRTKSEFKEECPTAYRVCCVNGWLDRFVHFVNGKIKPKKWNKELCFAEARRYLKISDFAHKALGAYKCAKKYGWLDDYVWFKRNRVVANGGGRKSARACED